MEWAVNPRLPAKVKTVQISWENDSQEPCSFETYGIALFQSMVLNVILRGISALFLTFGCSMGSEPRFLPSRSGLPKTLSTVLTFAGGGARTKSYQPSPPPPRAPNPAPESNAKAGKPPEKRAVT